MIGKKGDTPVFFVYVVLVFLWAGISAGQVNASPSCDRTRYLPIGHPAYYCLDRLQERGCLSALDWSLRPYTRLQVLEAIRAQEKGKLLDFEQQWLERLRADCEVDPGKVTGADTTAMRVVARLEASGDFHSVRPDKQRNTVGLSFGGSFGPVVFDARFLRAPHLLGPADSTMHRDPDVLPPFEEGLIRPMEGYLKADFRWFGNKFSSEVFCGRLARNWSPALDQSLILGADAASFDHLALCLRSRHFVFSHLVAALDGMTWRTRPGQPWVRAKRYLSAHRLDIRVRDNLRFGISETVVYGGQSRGFDPGLMNPAASFRLVSIQNKVDHAGNTFVSLDGLFIAAQRLTLFGQFLFDDMLRSNRYQDRWACDLGLRLREVPGLTGSTAGVRATIVSSFAYNTFNPYERYLIYGRPLGAPSGNDYRFIEGWLRYFINSRIDLKAHLDLTGRGAQRVAGSIEPFTGSTGLEFPTPVVERTITAGLALRWQPLPEAHFTAECGLINRKNVDNNPGKRSRRGYLSLAFSIYRDFPFEF
ncbi:MAG: capsule assembly Wzi family protein [Gemmatimonadota bacterium]|nr:capsule assembly Wzi family protein [Gemmatimonadota bacterium]